MSLYGIKIKCEKCSNGAVCSPYQIKEELTAAGWTKTEKGWQCPTHTNEGTK